MLPVARADEEAGHERHAEGRVERPAARVVAAEHPGDADGQPREQPLHDEIAAELVADDRVAGELGESRAARAHQEAEGDPDRGGRNAHAARGEFERDRQQQHLGCEPELPAAGRAEGRADDRRGQRDRHLPRRGRRFQQREEQADREAGEKSLQLRQRMEERSIRERAVERLVRAPQPEREKEPGQDAEPRQDRPQREQHPS